MSTVLITGGSRGIGKSIVYTFAKNGYNVIFTYLNSRDESLRIVDDLTQKYGIEANCIKCDLKRESDIKNLIDIVNKQYQKIDCLINNAGIAKDASVDEKSAKEFMEVLEVNLIGTFLLCKYAKNIMDKGVIINISSTNGIDTIYPESIDYDASKAGVISLTHNFARAYAPDIRVNSIAPGWVNTDMNKELSPVFKMQEEENILLKRFAHPDEIANVALFLASSDASYINDTVIRVDGGIK